MILITELSTPILFPGKRNWTTEDFHGKMAALAEAVDKIISHGPDILLLQEIENENVLNNLCRGVFTSKCTTIGVILIKMRSRPPVRPY